ncbi:FERM and PDZ domain-containing protein 4 [Trichonephila clavata]|uniref:FERM and PDZ domain-containing protein 4 n=1 Tax=Trichonephila clavata TaxID=2740835 RepID=A0A8X6LAZ4_TRICU|nr:FERM and PDZ domain-containing protein 4 [Trichonephila clavata]
MLLHCYYTHETKTSSWLPPVESWDSGGLGLPYGWEAAFDREGKTYFINHVNKTTTTEDPRKDSDEEPPQPRDVELVRDPQKGFGFVAGSEKPVIVRFVTEGGPSEGKLLPGDQILQINGEDVLKSPRERVIELVRSCKHSVKLKVCQPITNNTTRKSALLTAAKKAKLKSNPSRPSPFDSHVPFMPNVLKVFLENGQTKSFKYDSTTTVQDVLNVLQEKLSINCLEHFSLVVEHIKSVRRNKLSILSPKDTLAKIAARPGAHHLRCLFRLTFVPKDIYDLMQRDPVAFDYLFLQSCNDVVKERFAPELKYDVALRLAALHLQQHAVSSGMQGKLVVKAIEREYGLEKFVPMSLLETMKRKELLKLLSQLMKQNQALSGPGQKQLTATQAKFHYLKIVSDLPTYGAKSFATCTKNSAMEIAILVGPRIGISQISTIRNIAPINLAQFGELDSIDVSREDDFSYRIKIKLRHPEKECLNIQMEDRETEEFVLVLERYYSQLVGMELPVDWKDRDPEPVERVLSYHSRHIVQDSPWSYCPANSPQKQQSEAVTATVRAIDLSIPPPPYILCEERRLSRSNSRDQFSIATSPSSVDHNMNEMQALVTSLPSIPLSLTSSPRKDVNISSKDKNTDPEDGTKDACSVADVAFTSGISEIEEEPKTGPAYNTAGDIDLHSVVSMELLEEENELDQSTGESMTQRIEIKSHEIMSRVTEMNKIVNDAQLYLQSSCESQPRRTGDLGLKSNDSLLFIPRHGTTEEYNNLLTPRSDLMPSESETESTPTNSPTHTAMLATEDPEANMKKMCSSFGLHSPHLFMSSLQQESEDIEELLRQLQTSTNLPFEENTLCLDPDIIDLTIIPPPSDDVDFCCVTPDAIDDKKSFLDQETGQRRDFYTTESDTTDAYQSETDENGITFSVEPETSTEIGTTNNEVLAEGEDDLSAYIIPPPPPSSTRAVEEQNRVLARFRQAAEEIRRMMAHGNENLAGSKYSDSMNSVSKFCTIPRRHEESHRPTLSSIASLVTPVRENHVKFDSSVSTTTSENATKNDDHHHNKDCSDNGSGVDSETGVSWRPQPPPRVKRNSLVPSDVNATGAHNHLRRNSGNSSNDHSSSMHGVKEHTSQSDSADNGHFERVSFDSQDSSSDYPTPQVNGYQNGHHLHKSYIYNGYTEESESNGHYSEFYVNGEYNGYESSEFQPGATECDVCVGAQNGLVNGCVCKKINHFLSYHQSLPRKSMNTKLQPVNGGPLENGFEPVNGKISFQSAQQEIADMIENLDLACRARLQECSECLPKPGHSKLAKVRDTLIYESRQFVTASKLFVKSITESSDKMEEHLTTCIALLDRIFAVSELVVMEMTLPSQINSLVEKLKEMAVAYSRTVQAAHSAASGEIPNSNMAGLMHQATSLATSLTVLMRTLRTFNGP